MNEKRVENLWREIIEEIGDEPKRVGLRETPERIAKMYKELFRGYDKNQLPKVTIFPNGTDGVYYDNMVCDKGYFFSHCEHHMVPFFGKFYFAYIPDKLILGASKISRVIDYYSARLQIAERLCQNVITCLSDACTPKGIILIMEGRHLCKEMRGVKKFNSPFEVIDARGFFDANKDGCKDEFLSRIQTK